MSNSPTFFSSQQSDRLALKLEQIISLLNRSYAQYAKEHLCTIPEEQEVTDFTPPSFTQFMEQHEVFVCPQDSYSRERLLTLLRHDPECTALVCYNFDPERVKLEDNLQTYIKRLLNFTDPHSADLQNKVATVQVNEPRLPQAVVVAAAA